MTGRTVNYGIVISNPGLLRGARNAINVSDESDHWFARTVGRDPSRRDRRNSTLEFEPILLKNVGQVARGFELLETELRIAKDLVHHLLREDLAAVDILHSLG